MQKETENWFSSWFDTPYYHILYQDRGHHEAVGFMKKLTSFLKLRPNDTILDLACGRGRHSITLNSMGFDVTGIDLSPSSIVYAKDFENDTLHFAVHDMCRPFPEKFDAVFNLFTSFGYFEKEEDNFRTIAAIKANLNPKGVGVIDFMNVDTVIDKLVEKEVKHVGGIDFYIHRYVKDGFIHKNISFTDVHEEFKFTEKVKILRQDDFNRYFDKAGLQLTHCFGDYQMNPFQPESSDRLILIFKP